MRNPGIDAPARRIIAYVGAGSNPCGPADDAVTYS